MFDGLLCIDLPQDTHLIGYADDTLIISHSDNTDILELRLNESLFRVKKWLDQKCIQLAVHKTEKVLVTDRRAFRFLYVLLEGKHIVWGRQIIYLGVEIDHRLNFGPHINKMADKAANTGACLARLMSNVHGPKEKKRRMISGVVHSRMLYAAPV